MQKPKASGSKYVYLMNKKRLIYGLGILCLFVALSHLCLPRQLFNAPYSHIVMDRDGHLLHAGLAKDEQWRFPIPDSVPRKFEQCIIQFEDAHFYKHPGINPFSIWRALKQNSRAGEVVSGASTLSMQTIRLSRNPSERSIKQKCIEAFLALHLEWRYSKEDILKMYCAHAPFGGNVVGLDAASWRYFGKASHRLSWAESACLAVLPNSPGMIHPGRNRHTLRDKRNRLLVKLKEQGIISVSEYQLSLLEDIPAAPERIPSYAPHFASHLKKKHPKQVSFASTLDGTLQRKCLELAHYHYQLLGEKEIQNLAILVLDTKTAEVKAYVGNSTVHAENGFIDMVQRGRSSGSILKPLLYHQQLLVGQLTPEMMVLDIPSYFNGYSPKNFSKTFSGAIKANESLARSLNVPAVRGLQKYGVARFHADLEDMGFSTVTHSSSHYGLPLILGGMDVSLWDLCKVYASMGNSLLSYISNDHLYDQKCIKEPHYLLSSSQKASSFGAHRDIFGAAEVWATLQAMESVKRPTEMGDWESYHSAGSMAWKTGTSFGNKDAWAVGVTPEYTIGIWVGNADGEGRPDIIGASTAGQVLFDIYSYLGPASTFPIPYYDLIERNICKTSGHVATSLCPDQKMEFVPTSSSVSLPCPYHKKVWISESNERVFKHCAAGTQAKDTVWFSLPPQVANYYKESNPSYIPIPKVAEQCPLDQLNHDLALSYPSEHCVIYIPKALNEEKEKTIFSANHRQNDATLFWHIDGTFIAKTEEEHSIAISPQIGMHTVLVMDVNGNQVSQTFEVVN